jgi:cell wall-associated NlpC family hydrolase
LADVFAKIGDNRAMTTLLHSRPRTASFPLRSPLVPGARPLATLVLALAIAGTACASPPNRHATIAKQPAVALPTTTPTLWQQAQDVAIFALGLIGVDYRFGGESPATGVDCSGLVRYVFQQTTGITLPRTSAQLGKLGANVGGAQLMPGDLVFFNTRRFVNSHVGIYLGDNRFVHAPSTGSEVEISSLDEAYWRQHFTGARRLIGVLPDIIPAAVAAEPLPAPFATTATGPAIGVSPTTAAIASEALPAMVTASPPTGETNEAAAP